jgi:hypothetical protein
MAVQMDNNFLSARTFFYSLMALGQETLGNAVWETGERYALTDLQKASLKNDWNSRSC